MKRLITIIFIGSMLFLASPAQAEFAGCDDFCGRRAMNEGQKAIDNGTKTLGASVEAYKHEIWAACMRQTVAEGNRSEEDCNNNRPASSVPVPSSNPNRCQSEYDSLVKACDDQIKSAQTSCDDTQDSGIKSAQSSASGTSTSTEGVTDSCGGAGSVSSTAKNAWSNFKNTCSSAVGSCHSACGAVLNWANSNASCFPLASGLKKEDVAASVYSPKEDSCQALESKVSSAQTMVNSYGDTASGSDSCKSDTAGGDSSKSGSGTAGLISQLGGMAASLLGKETATASSTAVTTFCTANPSYPGCGSSAAANCNDPNYASTNRVCQCAANPGLCRVEESSSSSMAVSNSNPGSRLGSDSNASIGGGDIPMTPVVPGAPRSSGDAQGIDGRQGAGAPVGNAGGGSGGGSAYKGAKVNDIPLPPSSGGTFGGGGGAGGKGFGSTGKGYGSSGSERTTASTAGGPNNPDLRQFLPGGTYNPRPNMVGGKVGVDGITGPNSNNWQKVQNRYQVLKESLYP